MSKSWTKSNAVSEITNLNRALAAAGLLLNSNVPVETRVPGPNGGIHDRVSWDSTMPELFEREQDLVGDYFDWLRHNEFSQLLIDGSMIQISYEFSGYRIEKHRLVYFPAPYDFDENILLHGQQTIGDLVEEKITNPSEPVKLRCPVRFDFDRTAEAAGHPATHLTILRSSCRVPVVAPISIGHFIRFVFIHFYAERWHNLPELHSWELVFHDRTMITESKNLLHIHFEECH